MSTLLYRGRVLARHPQRLYPALWVAAASVTIFSLLGIVSMTGKWHSLQGGGDAAQVGAPAASSRACSHCGVIESVRGLEGNATEADDTEVVAAKVNHQSQPVEAWQIQIRMDDGTLQTTTSRTRPELPIGTRVRLVDEYLTRVPEK